MCGICGAVRLNLDYPMDPYLVHRMASTMIHRGPDDEGYYKTPDVQLGNRRLSIIDIAGGHQPIPNEDQTLWITFNGEIYNHPELRGELERKGHQYRTKTDTETILHLYEEFGIDCLQHLNGMFGFALWDERRKTLYLARDRLGIKPLFYARVGPQMMFSSELKGLLTCPHLDRTLDMVAIHEYLSFLYVPEPRSIFKKIRKLSAGHYMKVSSGKIQITRYWDLPETRDKFSSPAECEESLLTKLKQSIRLRLMADVPIGVFLSGGIDSSAIVALISQMIKEPIQTFSMGFGGFRSYDETLHARLVSNLFGTEHHTIQINPQRLDYLANLVWHMDEPMGDPSALPQFELSKFARQRVKAVLVGEGGDELFGGYRRYLWDKIAHHYSSFPFKALLAQVAGLFPQSTDGPGNLIRLAKKFATRALYEPPRRYASWYIVFDETLKTALYSPDFLNSDGIVDTLEGLTEYFQKFQDQDLINTLCCVDIKHYLPGDLLAKADRMTMAHSLEARFPFLDHHLVEYSIRVPGNQKVRWLQTKYILRRALKDILPRQILARKKMGFGVPIDYWFRGEAFMFARELLFEGRTKERGYFNPKVIQLLFQDHIKRHQIYSYHLWALVILELWHREYVDAC